MKVSNVAVIDVTQPNYLKSLASENMVPGPEPAALTGNMVQMQTFENESDTRTWLL